MYEKALQFLVRREHSERELKQKLCMRYPEQKAGIDAIIEKLKAEHYLDDKRFIESRVRHRLGQGYGPNKIISELSQMHGIAKTEILQALNHEENQALDDPLKSLITKRFGHLDLTDFVIKNKAIQYCINRGFHLNEIKKILKSLE